MAKKKFKTYRRKSSGGKKVTHRRRRVGATALNFSATSPIVKWGSVALGFFKPDLIPLTKVLGDKIDPKIVGVGQAGLGFLLAMKKGKKNMITTVLGGYLLGAGVKNSLVSFGIMTGIGPYGRVPVIGNRVNGRVNGPYGNMPVLSGYTPNNALNGYSPNGTLSNTRVMAGVNTEASGYNSGEQGSGYMN